MRRTDCQNGFAARIRPADVIGRKMTFRSPRIGPGSRTWRERPDGNGPVCATRAHYNADADMCAHHHSARRQVAMECSGAPPRWPRFPRYSAGLYRASYARGALVGTGLNRHTPCTDVVPHQYRTSCGTVAREFDGRRQTGRDNAAQRDLWAPLADIEIGKEEDASSGPALGRPPFRRAYERS